MMHNVPSEKCREKVSWSNLIISGSKSLLVRITNTSKWDIHLQIFPGYPAIWPSWVFCKTQDSTWYMSYYEREGKIWASHILTTLLYQQMTRLHHLSFTLKLDIWGKPLALSTDETKKNLALTLADNASPKRMKSSVFDAQRSFEMTSFPWVDITFGHTDTTGGWGLLAPIFP